MSTVLWGARRGDVQYASRDFWRRNIPFGHERVWLDNSDHFDVGDLVAVTRSGEVLRISGKEWPEVGVVRS